LIWKLAKNSRELLVRAAEMGYAPAQGQLANWYSDEEGFRWAECAAAQGDRSGLFCLGYFLQHGYGCAKDKEREIELYRVAAELGDGSAQHLYGEIGFGELDWERNHWWARAAARGTSVDRFCDSVLSVLPSFEQSENGRILHIVGPVIGAHLDAEQKRLFGDFVPEDKLVRWQRLLELHRSRLSRARVAIHGWSIVALRLGVVKDIRVMIAEMVWEEVWRWCEKEKK
jgi:hypothetical protein